MWLTISVIVHNDGYADFCLKLPAAFVKEVEPVYLLHTSAQMKTLIRGTKHEQNGLFQ